MSGDESKPRPFDWPGIMRAGIRGLGLKPAEFWALCPGELLLMLGDEPGLAPMGRAGLDALAARFPDQEDKDDG